MGEKVGGDGAGEEGEADQGPLKREGNRGTDQGENNSLNGKFLAFFFFSPQQNPFIPSLFGPQAPKRKSSAPRRLTRFRREVSELRKNQTNSVHTFSFKGLFANPIHLPYFNTG